MGRRVREDGASEGRPGIGRIRVAPVGESAGNITPRASGQTSIWSLRTREPGKPIEEAEQMTAVATAGAVSHGEMDWHAIDWPTVHRTVRRLQVRIVQATQAGR